MKHFTIIMGVLLSFFAYALAPSSVLAATQSDMLAPQTIAALASDDYLTVAFALFSAPSQADIDALDGHFQSLLARELLHPTTRISTRPLTLQQRLVRRISPDPTFRTTLRAATLRSIQPGDVLLRRSSATGCAVTEVVSGCKRWAAVYDSAALAVPDRDGVPTVYTATPSGGVRVIARAAWLRGSAYVAIYRPSGRAATPASAITAFIDTYGAAGQTSFNRTQTDKTRDTQLSSAQLVWQFYRRIGIDLDSNDNLYAHWLRAGYSPLVSAYIATHAVAPDELALSPRLVLVAAGRLP